MYTSDDWRMVLLNSRCTTRKPTQISIWNFNSHHLLHQNLGVVQTLFDWARSLVLGKTDRQEEIDNIKEALGHSGYPDWTFKVVEDKQKEGKSKKRKVEKEKSLEGKERPGLAVLPYVKGLSEEAVRVLKKAWHLQCLQSGQNHQPTPVQGWRIRKIKLSPWMPSTR